MSEATKVLMDKANSLEVSMNTKFKASMEKAKSELLAEQLRHTRLVLVAQEICDHSEELKEHKERLEICSHPRYMEEYERITCLSCTKWLRDE